MFNGKYRPIDTVIENILRDTDYYNEIDRTDAIEWALRAMQLIGAPLVYDKRIVILPIENWRVGLPIDIVNLLGVRDSKTKQTFIESGDLYIEYNTEHSEDEDYIKSPLDRRGAIAGDKGSIFIPAYKVASGCIYTNVEEGEVEILYETFPVNEDGCIMIPDEERYLMAVEAYIIFKIDNKMYRRGVLPRHIRDASEQDWLWYVESAHSKIVTPSYDQAESLKNQIQKIRTDKNAHDYGYRYLKRPTVKKGF